MKKINIVIYITNEGDFNLVLNLFKMNKLLPEYVVIGTSMYDNFKLCNIKYNSDFVGFNFNNIESDELKNEFNHCFNCDFLLSIVTKEDKNKGDVSGYELSISELERFLLNNIK